MAGVLVSGVIPVYNGARFVGRAVRSLLDQEQDGLEVIVMDNASTDGTFEAASAIPDPRLRVVREEAHLPMYGNFNRAAGLASGRYLKFLCADDELAPGCLPALVGAMEAHPSAALAATARRAISEEGEPGERLGLDAGGLIPAAEALWLLCAAGNVVGEPSSVLLRREEFRRTGGFDPRFRQLGDVELWARLLTTGDLLYDPRPLAHFRRHPGQSTAANRRDPELWFREERWFLEGVAGWGQQVGWGRRKIGRARARLGARLLFHLGGSVRRGDVSAGAAFDMMRRCLPPSLRGPSLAAAAGYGLRRGVRLLTRKGKGSR